MMLLRPKNKSKRNFKIWFVAIIVLFFVSLIFRGFPPTFSKKAVLYAFKPAVYLKSKASFFLDGFKDKSEFQKEINRLKEELEKNRVQNDIYVIIEKENQEFRTILSADEKRELILATIILKPGLGIYNSLIVDAGSLKNVNEGMQVTAFGKVLLGHVFEVSSGVSRVKLISYPGTETNVFVAGQIPAIAVGLGGENLEINLPKDADIKIGDVVTTLGSSPFYLGVVSKIEKKASDAFQKIYFRLPVNIQELKNIYLVK